MTNLLPVRLAASLLVLAFSAASLLAAEVLPVVRTKTETYANVTLISQTPTHAFVQHSRGVANIKLAELDAATLGSLGIRAASVVADGAIAIRAGDSASARQSRSGEQFAKMTGAISGAIGKYSGRSLPPKGFVLVMLGAFAFTYLFFCYCAMLICRKAGTEPGLLVWLPVLQMIPLLRAAGMPAWWLVAMFLPVVNLIAQVLWCLNITKARGKGIITAILLILPVTNIFAFLYLAFADGSSANDEAEGSSTKPLETEPLPA